MIKKHKAAKGGRISYDAQINTRKLSEFSDETGYLEVKQPEKIREDAVASSSGGVRFDEPEEKDNVVRLKSEEISFNKERMKLREFYKKWKVGLINFSDIPEKYQDLLLKYYLKD